MVSSAFLRAAVTLFPAPHLQKTAFCDHWICRMDLRRSGQCRNQKCLAGQHGKMCCLEQKWASAFREKPLGGFLSTSGYNRRRENAVQPECVRITHFISFYGHISIFYVFVHTNVQVISLFIWRISFDRVLWPVSDQQSQ